MFERFMGNKRDREVLALEENVETINFNESEFKKRKAESEKMDEETIRQNKKHYSEEGLWEKIQKYAKKAGSSVIYAVLLLYFTMKKEEVPMQAKATIVGALGYFILPFDLIPDVAPGVGYVDDLGVLVAALMTVVMHIDEDIKTQARNKLTDWFGDDADTSDIDDKL